MSTIDSKIAKSAKGEMPATFETLSKVASFGEASIIVKMERIEASLFGTVLTDSDVMILDRGVIEYAGKLVALELINPGIDHWGKQPLVIGATGRNETKTWKDRTSDLRQLRLELERQLEDLWPEVQLLLPNRRKKRAANVPRVRQAAGVLTPDPFGFERPFAEPDEVV